MEVNQTKSIEKCRVLKKTKFENYKYTMDIVTGIKIVGKLHVTHFQRTKVTLKGWNNTFKKNIFSKIFTLLS